METKPLVAMFIALCAQRRGQKVMWKNLFKRNCGCKKLCGTMLYSQHDTIPRNKISRCSKCGTSLSLQHKGVSQLGGVWKWEKIVTFEDFEEACPEIAAKMSTNMGPVVIDLKFDLELDEHNYIFKSMDNVIADDIVDLAKDIKVLVVWSKFRDPEDSLPEFLLDNNRVLLYTCAEVNTIEEFREYFLSKISSDVPEWYAPAGLNRAKKLS